MQINDIRSIFLDMKTKAYIIATALVALMTAGIVSVVASPVQSITMDHTAKGGNGEVAGSGGAGGIGGHGGYGGKGTLGENGKVDSGTRNNDDGYGGNGGAGGNANGGTGYSGLDGADQTIIDIHKSYNYH
jgi:hypothetical protein